MVIFNSKENSRKIVTGVLSMALVAGVGAMPVFADGMGHPGNHISGSVISGSEVKNHPKDGSYTVEGHFLKNNGQRSMADKGLGDLVFEFKTGARGPEVDAILTFKPVPLQGKLGYLGTLSTKSGAGFKEAEVLEYWRDKNGKILIDDYNKKSKKPYPKKVKFSVPMSSMKDGNIAVKVFVPVMESILPGGGTQEINLHYDIKSLKPVAEKPSENKPVEKPEQDKVLKDTAPVMAWATTSSSSKKVGKKNFKKGRRYVRVSWKKVDGAKKYRVFYSTNGKKFKKTSMTTKTAKNFKSFKNGKKAYFKVKAYDKNGKTLKSSNRFYVKAGTKKLPKSMKINGRMVGNKFVVNVTGKNLGTVKFYAQNNAITVEKTGKKSAEVSREAAGESKLYAVAPNGKFVSADIVSPQN